MKKKEKEKKRGEEGEGEGGREGEEVGDNLLLRLWNNL